MRMKEAVDEEQASEPKHRFCTTKWNQAAGGGRGRVSTSASFKSNGRQTLRSSRQYLQKGMHRGRAQLKIKPVQGHWFRTSNSATGQLSKLTS